MNNLPANRGTAPVTSQVAAFSVNIKAELEMGNMILRSGMCPTHFKTAEAVVTAIWFGREIGFGPMQSLQLIQVIQGKPCVSAAGLQAKALQSGGSVEEVEHDETICRLKITRGKVTREFGFTIQEATQMGLIGKDNWKRMPKDMLYARAVSRGIRAMFADKVAGLYGAEEMMDSVDAAPLPSSPDPVVIADEQPPPTAQTFKYDLVGLPVEHLPKAVKLLQKEGAKQLDESTFVADHRIAKLDNYEVKDGLELAAEAINEQQGA